MKATDFRREHFSNGRSFPQADFDGYIQASAHFSRTLYTKYLPCMAGGILTSFLFSAGVGGFAGNILAVLCIFAGLIIGASFNRKAGKSVNEYAARLGISNADVAAAKRHVKNGTVAWSDSAIPQSAIADAVSANKTAEGQSNTSQKKLQPAEAQLIELLPENPRRAVWTAVLAATAWLLLLILQSIFGPNTRFNADALFLTVAVLVGTAACLLTCAGLKYKIIGAGTGLVAAVMDAFTIAFVQNPRIYVQRVHLYELISLKNMFFFRAIGGVFLAVTLSLAAAWLIASLVKKGDHKRRVRTAALGAAGVYLLCGLIRSGLNIRGVPIPNFAALFSVFSGSFFDAACVFLVCMAVYRLCNMRSTSVKLHGIGLIWAWLAAIGMAVSLIAAISAGTSHSGVITYTSQYILAASGLVGYILLICKRRVGLYVILLGVGVMLGAGVATTLTGVFYRANQFALLFVSNLLGALNPLFAYLAVRAGTNAAGAAPVPAVRVES